MAPVPVQQRLGLTGDGGVARRQHKGGGAHFRESRLRRVPARFRPARSTANKGWRAVQPQKYAESRLPLVRARQKPARGLHAPGAGSARRAGTGPRGLLRRQPGRIGAPVPGAVQRIAGEGDGAGHAHPFDNLPSSFGAFRPKCLGAGLRCARYIANMIRVFGCIFQQHDLQTVVLAAVLCLFACGTALTPWSPARAPWQSARARWSG